MNIAKNTKLSNLPAVFSKKNNKNFHLFDTFYASKNPPHTYLISN